VTLAPAAFGTATAAPAPAAAGVAAAAQAPNPRTVAVTWAQRATGFSKPLGIETSRDGTGRLFVVTKGGIIYSYRPGGTARPYLDMRHLVLDQSEGGLLGLAFSPRFRTSPWLWVSYTARDGSHRVARLRAPAYSAATVRASALRVVLTIPHPDWRNHYAGQIAFGPDGYLYIATGDGGGPGDIKDNARRLNRLGGKLLRIHAYRGCSGRLYCVPASNPFVGRAGARGEIYHYGLRNPWRFSFDPVTRRLWLSDVGQERFEEVNVLAATTKGRYLGWSCREGRSTYNQSRCAWPRPWLDPSLVYGRSAGESITGGYVYRGRAYRSLLEGIYVYGDFVSGRVWVWRQGDRSAVTQTARLNGVTSFGVDAANEIWAVTYDGRLHSMRAAAR